MNHQYGALSFKCSASGRPLESQRGNGSGINAIGGGNADKPSSYNYEKDDGSVDRYILHGLTVSFETHLAKRGNKKNAINVDDRC